MKVKLLKKLRAIGRGQVNVYSITTTNGCTTGVRYGHPGEGYLNLFSSGDTEADIKEKAMNIWFCKNSEWIRKKYKKYTRRYRFNKT